MYHVLTVDIVGADVKEERKPPLQAVEHGEVDIGKSESEVSDEVTQDTGNVLPFSLL